MIVANIQTHFLFRGNRHRSNIKWQFVSDSQDVEAIKQDLGKRAHQFDSFFVVVGNGDYDAVYGMRGIIPWLWNTLTRLV